MKDRIIFHIDCNSAYLSFEAANRLRLGHTLDIRTIPSVVGGDPKTRRGIILAKSNMCKQYKIQTGETLYTALAKCPSLLIVKPNYKLYMKCSDAMCDIIREYSSQIQRFSIDEVFVDYTESEQIFGDPITVANTIRERIKNELGFTVNIGVSNNKLLAKMGSDNFEKPDKTHTLWPHEVKEKFWPLPIGELFMVGRATEPKLKKMGIETIGDLARMDPELVKLRLKSHGLMIWQYANGIEDSVVRKSNYMTIKGIGNSTTIPFDVDEKDMAYKYLLSLTESVASRLRSSKHLCQVIQVSIKYSDFSRVQHQKKLFNATDLTNEIYFYTRFLFDEAWNGDAIRHLGIRVSNLIPNDNIQYTLFEDPADLERKRKLDATIDNIRNLYGGSSIYRSTLLHSPVKPMTGGVEESYPLMTSLI